MYTLKARMDAITASMVAFVANLTNTPVSGFYALQAQSNLSEMIANANLALRHSEDASNRIGKALQAWNGGVSNNPV